MYRPSDSAIRVVRPLFYPHRVQGGERDTTSRSVSCRTTTCSSTRNGVRNPRASVGRGGAAELARSARGRGTPVNPTRSSTTLPSAKAEVIRRYESQNLAAGTPLTARPPPSASRTRRHDHPGPGVHYSLCSSIGAGA